MAYSSNVGCWRRKARCSNRPSEATCPATRTWATLSRPGELPTNVPSSSCESQNLHIPIGCREIVMKLQNRERGICRCESIMEETISEFYR